MLGSLHSWFDRLTTNGGLNCAFAMLTAPPDGAKHVVRKAYVGGRRVRFTLPLSMM